jgi:4-amino-4-deoxy-L-arabinose transferase-like glycosyltransferase
MQLLLGLIAINMVVFGVLNGSMPWVMTGAVAIGLLSSGRLGTMQDQDVNRFTQFVKSAWGPPWRRLLLIALICSLFAGWLSHQNYYSTSSVYVWSAALLMTLGAGFLHDRARTQASLSHASAFGDASEDAKPNAPGQWTRLDWAIAALLTLVALGLRLYQLGVSLPPVHGDEGEMGMLALLARYGPASGVSLQNLPFFGVGFLDHPTLFHYVQAFGMRLFGDTITGLRTLSVLFGALCAPFIYAIGRAGWGRVAGLTAGWLLAVSHLHIHYSRIALNNIETVLFVILLIWLLARVHESNSLQTSQLATDAADPDFRAQRQPALMLFILIGLTIGLSQYFYYGSRLLPVLAAPLLFYLWRLKRATFQQIAVLIIATFIAYFPLMLFYTSELDTFLNRTQGVTVFTPEGMAHALGAEASWPQDIPLLLWSQIKTNLYFFLSYGDDSSFYLADIPGFDQATVILFWLGLGLVLAKVRRYHEMAIVTWLGLGVFLAGVLTNNAPNGPRLITAVPAVYLIGGVFIQNLANLVNKFWPTYRRAVGLTALAPLAAVTLYLNFNTYFVNYKERQPNLHQVYIAQEIATAGEEYTSYLLGAPNIYVWHGTIKFMAATAEKFDLEEPAQFIPLLAQQSNDRGALLIALPQHVTELEQIEAQFPNGTKAMRQDTHGKLLYVTYEIPATEIVKQLAQKAK